MTLDHGELVLDDFAADLPTIVAWLGEAGFALPARVDREAWASRLCADGRIRIRTARLGGRPVGFHRLDLAPDRSAELTVLVDAGVRRRGIGRVLVQDALDKAAEHGVARLVAIVAHDNQVASSFFREQGFRPSGAVVPGFEHLARLVHRSDRQRPLEIVP